MANEQNQNQPPRRIGLPPANMQSRVGVPDPIIPPAQQRQAEPVPPVNEDPLDDAMSEEMKQLYMTDYNLTGDNSDDAMMDKLPKEIGGQQVFYKKLDCSEAHLDPLVSSRKMHPVTMNGHDGMPAFKKWISSEHFGPRGAGSSSKQSSDCLYFGKDLQYYWGFAKHASQLDKQERGLFMNQLEMIRNCDPNKPEIIDQGDPPTTLSKSLKKLEPFIIEQ